MIVRSALEQLLFLLSTISWKPVAICDVCSNKHAKRFSLIASFVKASTLELKTFVVPTIHTRKQRGKKITKKRLRSIIEQVFSSFLCCFSTSKRKKTEIAQNDLESQIFFKSLLFESGSYMYLLLLFV